MPDKPLRIVVTGRNGQVARALAERLEAHKGYDLVHAARPDIDLRRPGPLAEAIAALEPDLVVNAAAYTAVDKAESEPDEAMTVNAVAPGEIARGAGLSNAPIIHVSTDYVFDGTLDRPYREDDPVAPLGVYGRTKLAGEEAVRAANPRHVILRTAWVYSPFGGNFVKTMLRLAETRDQLGVVSDQHGNPTSAFAIADAIIAVADRLAANDPDAPSGVYHLTGSGDASWFDLAKAVFEIAGPQLARQPLLRAIATADYPTPARRPANSRLDAARFEADFGYRAPPWREDLRHTLARLVP